MAQMIARLFGTNGFSPHGFCLLWDPAITSLNVVSDVLIGIAYFSIPLALLYFVRKREDLVFGWVFGLFAAFILACGTTHFFEVFTLWHPYYGIQGLIKAATAATSLVTALFLWPLIPKALALPSPTQLRNANEQLARQIRERNDACDKARESEEKYRLLFEHVTDYAIFMIDDGGIVTTWNAGAQRITGYRADEIVGRHFSIFSAPDDRDRGLPAKALEIAASEGKHEAEMLRVRKDGSRFWANVVIDRLRDPNSRLVGFAMVTRDVTERRLAQEELQRTRAALAQSQKMDAIGQLAGGMAHDLNNFLTTVIGNIELFQRRAEIRNEADCSVLAAALTGAEAGAALISKVLAFSRKQVLAPVPCDLNKVVSDASQLLRSALGETVKLEVLQADGLWRTMIDPNLMETALLNLALNARDAMPRGGLLTLETANTFLDDEYAEGYDIPGGPYVMIAMSDSGHGMDEATLARAFEPFYTTKAIGRGSGLGLSQVYGYVKQSGGHIKLYSEHDAGTTVKIYLPRLATDVEAERAASLVTLSPPTGHELVLVVEDDEGVRAFTRGALIHLGYMVLEAASPSEALGILEARSDIKLLFTDVVLPEMNGRRLADEALRRRPGLKAMFTSGYTQNAIVHHGRLDLGVHFVAKPFRLDVLARKIREVLDN
jgi:PAS domain S-box-containing protein